MSARRVLRAGGLWFDGVDDYVDIANGVPSSLLGSRVKFVVLWFYPVKGMNGLVYMGPSGGGGRGQSFRFVTDPSGKLGLDVSYGKSFSSIPITLNAWNLIFSCWDGSSYYVGKVTSTGVQKSSLSLPAQDLQQGLLRIGQEQPNNYYAGGIIDDVRIYNRALSDDEIRAIYERDELIKDGLVLYLDFTEYEGSIAYGKSGYGNHATIYGARWVVKKQLRTLPETG